MVKRLTRQGNSVAPTFDEDLVRLDPDATVDISAADEQTLIVTPIQSPEQTEDVERSLKKLDRKFGKVFKRLTEQPKVPSSRSRCTPTRSTSMAATCDHPPFC